MKADEDIVVNWEEHNIQPLKTTLCCPQVESARVHSFLQCVNHDCKKKVTPYPGETKVTCNAATCRRKMLVEWCKRNFNIEITLLTNECTTSGHCIPVRHEECH